MSATAYSSGHHGGAPQLRAILDDFGKRFGKYVLNLAGHSHGYERTKPQNHVVHVTAGIGGGALEHAATDCLWTDCKAPSYLAFRAIHHGFVKLTVREDGIALEVEPPVIDDMLARGKQAGIETRGPSDHGFIRSIYFRDPNGYVIELTAKVAGHDEAMNPARNDARALLDAWQAAKR